MQRLAGQELIIERLARRGRQMQCLAGQELQMQRLARRGTTLFVGLHVSTGKPVPTIS